MRRKSDRFLQIMPVLVRSCNKGFLFFALSMTIMLLSSFHCPVCKVYGGASAPQSGDTPTQGQARTQCRYQITNDRYYERPLPIRECDGGSVVPA